MKNIALVLLFLSSFSVMGQYHQHRTTSNISLASFQTKHQSDYSVRIKIPKTFSYSHLSFKSMPVTSVTAQSDNSLPQRSWRGTTVTNYSTDHRLQTSQTYDMRGNLVDSRASFNIGSGRRK